MAVITSSIVVSQAGIDEVRTVISVLYYLYALKSTETKSITYLQKKCATIWKIPAQN